MDTKPAEIQIKVGFAGGLELLFSNQRSHHISIPSKVPSLPATPGPKSDEDAAGQPNVTYLIHWLKDNLLKERPELFVEGDTVRPGILVLINDSDWELEGEGEYQVQPGDEIVFISTLHGG